MPLKQLRHLKAGVPLELPDGTVLNPKVRSPAIDTDARAPMYRPLPRSCLSLDSLVHRPRCCLAAAELRGPLDAAEAGDPQRHACANGGGGL